MKAINTQELFSFCVSMNNSLSEVIKMTEPKKTYKVPCVWEMYGWYEIEAHSMEEAIADVTHRGGLPEGEFIEGSFAIDHEYIEEV